METNKEKMTKRKAIESFRKSLQEQNADSNYTNQYLYDKLLTHTKWLIKREISAGRIYKNNSFFQTWKCQEIVEESTIDSCCPIKTNCRIYRTKYKIPEAWIDNNGPVLRNPTSVDRSTEFFIIGAQDWLAKKNNPYTKMGKTKYAFVADNYIFFPLDNPGRIHVPGFYTDDLALIDNPCDSCDDEKKDCIKFLDTKFMIPDWLEAEMFSKAIQELSFTKQLMEDTQIDKNPNRKN